MQRILLPVLLPPALVFTGCAGGLLGGSKKPEALVTGASLKMVMDMTSGHYSKNGYKLDSRKGRVLTFRRVIKDPEEKLAQSAAASVFFGPNASPPVRMVILKFRETGKGVRIRAKVLDVSGEDKVDLSKGPDGDKHREILEMIAARLSTAPKKRSKKKGKGSRGKDDTEEAEIDSLIEEMQRRALTE